MPPNQLLEAVEELSIVLVGVATGKGADPARYALLRKRLVEEPRLLNELPSFVRTCRTSDDFWQYIKQKFAHYQERRDFIRDQLAPVFDVLEVAPAASEVALISAVSGKSWQSVHESWGRIMQRKDTDPEGAITAARSLFESVCKCILDESAISYNSKAELPDLYRATAKLLKLAPEDHAQESFKQILGGCYSVVNGLAAIRNAYGDAHGQGTRPVKPGPRHAELAVNLACSMAAFLIATWEARSLAHKTGT